MQLLFAFKPLQQLMMIVNVVVLSFILIGCSKSDSTGTGASEEASDHNAIVRIDGSSTVFPVTEAVAEEFQIKTKTKVTVGVSGTGGGFKNSAVVKLIFLTLLARFSIKKLKIVKLPGLHSLSFPLLMMRSQL